jgi:hypothetical protein
MESHLSVLRYLEGHATSRSINSYSEEVEAGAGGPFALRRLLSKA